MTAFDGVIARDRVTPADPVGGKAHALARLDTAGFTIPPWFVLSPRLFESSLTGDQRSAFASARTAAELDALFPAIQIAAAARAAIAAELDVIGGSVFAVRSSALEEDSARYSFAGLLQSFLFVPAADVAMRVVDVWRSGFSERVLAYCEERGIPRPATAPAVVVQRMVDAGASGVAFSADPITGDRDRVVIGAVWGLGTSLVDGSADADTYRVDAADGIARTVAHKTIEHRRSDRAGTGVETAPVPAARADAAVLSDADIIAVAALARNAAAFFGRPQDIEWALEGGRLFLLQSRPITSLFDLPDPGGALNIWDNSNIVESYGGITTPLTFSFARNAYEGVYRQLCRTFGVPRARIEENTPLYANMLGLVRGRVYYNLLNWYRFMALLPGYRMNRGFMEQMMGVRESLPAGALGASQPVSRRARLADGVRFAGTVVGFGSQYFKLPRKMKAFYARLDAALANDRDLSTLRADELVAQYRFLESRLLSRWDAPLINDFYTMIFYGVLRRLCTSWCGDANATLQNDLLCGSGGMVSTEPAERVREMADIARADPALVLVLCRGSLADIMRQVESNPALRARYESYLQKFGERCLDELKLESSTLHDDPLMLFRSIGNLARVAPEVHGAATAVPEARARGEAAVARALARRPLRRAVFRWVLRNARERVRGRENLRLERTRLFGRVRRIMLELGRRFHERDLVDDPRDVFYLHLDEVLGFVEGTAVSTRLRDLARVRRDEFLSYANDDPPASRFETHGMVYVGNTFRPRLPPASTTIDTRKGIGCCPGRVSGRARVVRDPRDATIEKGSILVAERTDPGWIMLFPMAAGLLVERGSLLSHSAIVARELGIPAIVSIDGLLSWIQDGDWVELDGASGVARKIAAPPAEADARAPSNRERIS